MSTNKADLTIRNKAVKVLPMDVTPEIHAYLSRIGRKGGSQMSDAKLKALKQNARRPRPGARKSPVIIALNEYQK